MRKRTLANLSKLPDETVEGLRILLKGGQAIKNLEDAFEIIRTRPHGHVAAVLGTLRKIGKRANNFGSANAGKKFSGGCSTRKAPTQRSR